MAFLFKLLSKNRTPINSVRNPIFKLFLHGLKGIFQIKTPKPYNYYLYLFSAISAVLVSQLVIKVSKNQFDQRQQPNILIPKYIYKVRKQHFVYWQQARLAKGYPTTFTYYSWNPQSKMMYEIDRNGKQQPIQSHNTLETPQMMGSPLLQKHFPASPQLHSHILMYTKNIHNPYDLDNHLHHKSINMGDWIRACYYWMYRQLGLTNRFRYDEYVSKPDTYYDWQKAKLGFRISRDRTILYKLFDKIELDWEKIKTFLIWFL